MITLRPADQRGRTRISWLDARHSFSFANYYDPRHMGFRVLRVINDDTVAPAGGFDTHGHRDMEIITYPISGHVAHEDSTGSRGIIGPGDVQYMCAGTGIRHSEFNPSAERSVHLLQIWILPDRPGWTPSYRQLAIPEAEKRAGWRLLAAPDGNDEVLTIHQDVKLWSTLLETGTTRTYRPGPNRHVWLQMARGSADLDGQALGAGDGVAISDEESIALTGGAETAEILLFDLA